MKDDFFFSFLRVCILIYSRQITAAAYTRITSINLPMPIKYWCVYYIINVQIYWYSIAANLSEKFIFIDWLNNNNKWDLICTIVWYIHTYTYIDVHNKEWFMWSCLMFTFIFFCRPYTSLIYAPDYTLLVIIFFFVSFIFHILFLLNK